MHIKYGSSENLDRDKHVCDEYKCNFLYVKLVLFVFLCNIRYYIETYALHSFDKPKNIYLFKVNIHLVQITVCRMTLIQRLINSFHM